MSRPFTRRTLVAAANVTIEALEERRLLSAATGALFEASLLQIAASMPWPSAQALFSQLGEDSDSRASIDAAGSAGSSMSLMAVTLPSLHARSAPADASSNIFGAEPGTAATSGPEMAFDNSTSSYYHHAYATGGYVGLDAGSSVAVDHVRFYPVGNYAPQMVGATIEGSDSIDGPYSVVATIPSPVVVGWNSVSTAGATFRYWRFNGNQGNNSYSRIAELQFCNADGTPAIAPQSSAWDFTKAEGGQAIGYTRLAAGYEPDKAFDGLTSTYYVGQSNNNSWVGLDFGAATEVNAVMVRPLGGYEYAMRGGVIEGTNDPTGGTWTPLGSIGAQTWNTPARYNDTVYLLDTPANYSAYRYRGPAGSYSKVVELAFGTSEQGAQLPPPDLDIDSDNNNGYNVADSSDAEDLIESDTAKTGKIALVDNNDSDKDGIPDFADYDLTNAVDSETGEKRAHFVPLTIRVPDLVPLDGKQLVIKYDGYSSPNAVTLVDGEYQVGSGSIRLWRKEATELRNPTSVTQGGDLIVSDVPLDPSMLLGQGRDTTIWLEAVRPSATSGDQEISLSVQGPGSNDSDSVRVTTVQLDYLGIKLNAQGDPVYDAQGPVYDHVLAGSLQATDSRRLESYYQWKTRSAPESGAITVMDDIAGDLGDSTSLDSVLSLDRLTFKLRALGPESVLGDALTLKTFVNNTVHDEADLQLVPNPAGQGFVSSNPILLYQQNGPALNEAAIATVLTPGIRLFDPDSVGVLIKEAKNPDKDWGPARRDIEKFNVFLGQGSPDLWAHDPTTIETLPVWHQNATAGQRITEWDNEWTENFQSVFQIDADDNLAAVSLESRLNGKPLVANPPEGYGYEWFLHFRFKAGDFKSNVGHRFDINRWYKLDGDNVVNLNANASAGLLPIGDYEVFWRAKFTDAAGKVTVGETNLVDFSVLGTNPGKDRIVTQIDTYTNPAIGDLKGWYKAICARESAKGAWDRREDWDQFENNPDSDGLHVGYKRGMTYEGVRYEWEARFGFPFASHDNGWGISQMTTPPVTPAQIARWKANLARGWDHFTNDRITAARDTLSKHGNPTDEMIIREAVARYRGEHAYTWNAEAQQWVANADPNAYINLVEAKKTENSW